MIREKHVTFLSEYMKGLTKGPTISSKAHKSVVFTNPYMIKVTSDTRHRYDIATTKHVTVYVITINC